MPHLGTVTPILRIFDIAKAQEFYIGFLGFTVLWEHRYGENMPLYMAVGRDDCVLHLSEHYGDASPGSAVRIRVADATSLHHELHEKDYRFAKPGLCKTAYDTREISVTDPFGNRLHFFEELPEYRQRPRPEPANA